MTFTNLLYQLEAETGILTITVNRPDKLNALNAATIEELRHAAQQARQDDAVRGIILTGSGEKSFVAGADIAELTKLDAATGQRAAEQGQEAFRLLEESSKPVIAAVNGFALGGGCELAMACHMRIASDNARFGQPEVNLGLIPGYGGTQRLTQLIGKGKALELLLTADMIKADEALRLGLVNHVVPQAELLNFTKQLLSRILTKAPLAVGLCIDAVSAYYDKERQGYQTEAESFGQCFTSADFREGTTAFLEKRPATFTGK
ncbi:enoyl-CoA hydratase/isomerase family protein [Hymenobacter sp. HSC-4F20]|uniref:enoyl-CoA hydratase/isomerase family protein n=1 Tax=Hymenobacter sp. HSC-4F20 TaxID=2864135 RepID=UPI001C72CA82|nr:enoyl-CoA hydratase-related protein [Hymenobacter sp. HSC-4F20]MBX0291350.1 enoyl-CoA hydratase/isomerase family protein [Hymenobacter sp. HSC-4F20]